MRPQRRRQRKMEGCLNSFLCVSSTYQDISCRYPCQVGPSTRVSLNQIYRLLLLSAFLPPRRCSPSLHTRQSRGHQHLWGRAWKLKENKFSLKNKTSDSKWMMNNLRPLRLNPGSTISTQYKKYRLFSQNSPISKLKFRKANKEMEI